MNRQKIRTIALAVLVNLLMVVYFLQKDSEETSSVSSVEIPDKKPVFSQISKEDIEDYISHLSLHQKIAQLFVADSSLDAFHIIQRSFLPDTVNNQSLRINYWGDLYQRNNKVSYTHLSTVSDPNFFREWWNDIHTFLPFSNTDLVLIPWNDSTGVSFVEENFRMFTRLKDSLENKGILMGIEISRDFNFDYLDSLNRFGFPFISVRDTVIKDLTFRGVKMLKTDRFDQNQLNNYDLIASDNTLMSFKNVMDQIQSGTLKEDQLNQLLNNTVAAQIWIQQKRENLKELLVEHIESDSTLTDSMKNERFIYYRRDSINSFNKWMELCNYYERKVLSQSFVLLSKKSLPFRTKSRIDVYSKKELPVFTRMMRNFKSISVKKLSYKDSLYLKRTSVIWIDTLLDSAQHHKFIKSISNNPEAVVVLEGNYANHKLIKANDIIIINSSSEIEQHYLAQSMNAAHPIQGRPFFSSEISEKKISMDVIGYDDPLGEKLSKDTLNKIRYMINHAINYKAFPGAQVIVLKNSKIVYRNALGHHTYKRKTKVKNDHLYDIASVTKVAATTLMAMKMLEDSLFQLDDSLWEYLPEDTLKPYLKTRKSTIRNITFRELLLHRSGLPAGMDLIGYMLYTDSIYGRYDKYYCDLKDSVYCVPVAEEFYLEKGIQDSLWVSLNQIWLDPEKPYLYSDISMNLLYEIFSSILEKKGDKVMEVPKNKKEKEEFNYFEAYLQQKFYQKLEMDRTVYRPLRYFDEQEIVPTEDESYWRKQLLRGHVHDPYAALLGGIAGNAGLYTNVTELSVLFQMWLNKGFYKGKRYLNKETVQLFTKRQEVGFRGLGFNKPSGTGGFGIPIQTPIQTFGHTGFTGICAWADPKNKLVYIFMSNRVHPKVNKRIYHLGIRKKIFQTIYDAFITGAISEK